MKKLMRKVLAAALAVICLMVACPKDARADGEWQGRKWTSWRWYQGEVDDIMEAAERGEVIVIDNDMEVDIKKEFEVRFNKNIGKGFDLYLNMVFEDKDGCAVNESLDVGSIDDIMFIEPDRCDYFPESRHYIHFKKGLPSKDGKEVLEKDVYFFFTTKSEDDLPPEIDWENPYE